MKHLRLFEDFKEKDLVQFKYKMMELFYNFSQPTAKNKIDGDALIDGLREVEKLARESVGSTDPEEGLWWRYFEGDTGANTIRDVEKTLALHPSHNNYKFMIEQMQMTGELNNEMKVYFS